MKTSGILRLCFTKREFTSFFFKELSLLLISNKRLSNTLFPRLTSHVREVAGNHQYVFRLNVLTADKIFLCLCFRASLIYINNCPTKCNTKQSIYYSASSLCMFRVSTTPIIRSTQNCNYSLRYWSYFCAATSLQRGQASCTVNLQNNK